jgi:hypothetical protein
MIGDVAGAILFICTLVGLVIVGAYVLGYAARCLLTVVQETAAGTETMSWPDEPFIDGMLGAAHVVVLALLLVMPGGFAARAAGDPRLFFLVAAPTVWLLFPVALLSSMASRSRWAFFRPAVVGRLLRVAPATTVFYLAGAALAAATAAAWYHGVFGGRPYLIPVAAAVGSVALLLYARMLGRLASLVGQFGPLDAPPTEEGAAPAPKKRKGKKPKAVVTDPWATPDDEPEVALRADLPVDGYDLSGEPDPPPPDIALLSGRLPETERAIEEERRQKAKAARRRRPPRGGAGLVFRGLARFPFEGKTAQALLWLALGSAVFAYGLSLAASFAPG